MQRTKKRKFEEVNNDEEIKNLIVDDISPITSLKDVKIECKFNEYLLNMFADYKTYFLDWDLSKIYAEKRLWQLEDQFMYIYIIVQSFLFDQDSEKKSLKISGRAADSYIGITKDINTSIQKYNSKPPQSKRGTTADYKILLYCVVPPYRNYSTIPLKKICKIGRSWGSKCKKLILLSEELGLQWRIARCILDDTSPFFSKTLYQMIQKITPNIENTIINESGVNFPILGV